MVTLEINGVYYNWLYCCQCYYCSETRATFRKKELEIYLFVCFSPYILAVSCSNDDSGLSPFKITLNVAPLS